MSTSNPEHANNVTAPFPLIASEIGEYVLYKERVYSPPDLPEPIGQAGSDLPPNIARPVIVWRIAEGIAVSLKEAQKNRLDEISQGKTQEAMARDRGTTDRNERYHAAKIYSKLQVHSASSGVVAGICAKLLDIDIEPAASPYQEWLTEYELTICRMLGMGATPLAIAKQLWIVERTERLHIQGICDKIGAQNRPHIMRRLFELDIFQVHSPERIFDKSSKR